MKELISLNVGQAGIQLSSAAWELFCIEHGIRSDGSHVSSDEFDIESAKSFFYDVNEKFVPRSLKIDFEPTVLDEVRVGVYKNLFNPNFMISGLEDASSNFARAYITESKRYLKPVARAVRKLMEQCSCLQGFCIFNSFDGGTGSGFTSLLEQELSVTCAKIPKFQLGIYPSKKLASSTVYPYNALLHAHFTVDHTDMCPLLDNESLYNMSCNKLHIDKPTFTNINRIIAQIYSNITVSLRFENSISNSINQLCTNLVPYPKIHFVLSHISPICTQDVHDKSSFTVTEITDEVFLPDSQLARCNTAEGKFMACVLQYRGDVMPIEVNKSIFSVKKNQYIQFVDWCPTGFKVGISSRPSASPPGSAIAQVRKNVTMLSNTSSIVDIWQNLIFSFDCLYSKKAFVHWFVGEGLELDEFQEAKNTLKQIIQDYLEVAPPTETMITNSNEANDFDVIENEEEMYDELFEEKNFSNSFKLLHSVSLY